MAGMADFCTLEIAFPDNEYAVSKTWTDVTADLRGAVGGPCRRSNEFETFAPGQMTFTLDNRDRTYDPLHSAGTHFGDFRRGRPVRFTGEGTTSVTPFHGYVLSWNPQYPNKDDAFVVVTCMDGLWLLGETGINALTTPAFAADSSTTRMGRILDEADWPSADRSLAGGQNPMTATSYGKTALALMVEAAQADAGLVFHEPHANEIRFDIPSCVQIRPSCASIQETFDDNSTAYKGRPFIRDNPAPSVKGVGDDYRSVVEITSAETGVASVESTTAADQAAVSYEATIEVLDQGSASMVATIFSELYNSPQGHVEAFGVTAYATTGAVDKEVLDITIRDRVRVRFTPPGSGGGIVTEGFVDAIKHTITPTSWEVLVTLTDAEAYDDLSGSGSWLILDDATDGQQDQELYYF